LYEKGKGMSIKTMKQALDALNTCDYDYDYEESMYKTYDSKLIDLAIEALSQAIAEAEKEATLQEISDIGQWNTSDMAHRPNGLTIDDDIQEYKKPWFGLTDTEILNIIESDHGKFMIIKIAETKLRERNNG
jgi:hypothetical protein